MRINHAFCFILIGCLSFFGTKATAEDDCAGRAVEIIQQAYPSAHQVSEQQFTLNKATIATQNMYEIDRLTYDTICRVWPAYPDLLLVAVPIMSRIDDDITEGNLELLILNNDNLKIQKRLLLEDMIESDAFYISNISFDTARYKLSPDQTSFGLRISKTGSSRINQLFETRLWLFAQDQDSLRTILPGALIEGSAGIWDGICAGEHRTKQRTLEMSDIAHNGAADIIMSGKEIISRATETADGGCDEHTLVEETSTATLIYNGEEYPYPSSIWNW